MRIRATTGLALAALCLVAQSHALGWVGNTRMSQSGGQLPYRGSFLEPWQQLDITSETWPIEPGQRMVAVVTTNNFQSSQEYEFTWIGNFSNNSRWSLRLPTFPQGSQVQFYIRGTKTGQANAVYDNQSGGNFGFLQRFAPPYSNGSILQWFATDYKTIMRRLPEVVEAGYSAIYLPGPTKGGVGGFSSGYDPMDRFDLGDRLQKGTVRTNFGTTQELVELIRVAKRLGIQVFCDLITNHNSNRANHPINQYPDMIPEDFHIKSSTDTSNPEINFNTESAFSYGMLNNDLVGLVDMAHEDGNNARTGTFTLPSYATNNVWGKPSFVRNPTVPQLYANNSPYAEDVRELLDRWVRWLAGTIGFDGFRIDAVKHTPPGYFGWAPDQAASQNFSNGNLIPRSYAFNPNLTFFGEEYSSNSYELREYAKTGMNLLDFPLFFNLKNVFNANGLGDIGAALGSGYGSDASTGLFYQQGGLTPDVGVSFIQSHDDGPPTSNNIAEAFILGRPGRSKIYYDGNNIQPGNWTNFPKPGRFDALGNGSDLLTKLVEASGRFARGYSTNRWTAPNVYVFERQVANKGILLVGLNDRGDNVSETVTVQTAFAAGTTLVDYGGQRPPVTVNASGQVTITIPPNYSATESNNGKGYVFYAPVSPAAVSGIDPVTVTQSDGVSGRWNPLAQETFATPGGVYSTGRSFKAVTITQDRATFRLRTDATGFSALVKIDNGVGIAPFSPLTASSEGLATGFIPMTKQSNGNFVLSNLDVSGLEDGLHLFKFRVFADTGSNPGVYSDFNQFVYIRRGLTTDFVLDGDLTDLGGLISSQARTASSNLNRIDGLYAANDDRYLYIGIPGRVDPAEGLTNGMGLAIDIDGIPGVRDLSLLNDDSGPAARLLSNTRLNLPATFGADYVAGIFRNSSATSAPEAPFPGGLVTPPPVGAQAGVFRINSSDLRVLTPIRAGIATQIRVNKTDPAKGAEIAIPLRTLFPSGLTGAPSVNLIAWLGTTGEKNSFLLSTDPLRATLGGRPAPEAYLTNQVIPSQSAVVNDPGTGAVNLTASRRFDLTSAFVTTTTTVNTTPLVFNSSRNVYVQDAIITNTGATALPGSITLRLNLPSGVTLANRTEMSMIEAGRPYITSLINQLAPNSSVRIRLEYTAPNAGAITPTFEVLSGRGVL